MIQLSAILSSGSESARKTADFALLDGGFEQLLAEGAAEASLPGGKILPEGGKTLPDVLPTVEVPSLVGRKLIAQFVVKEAKPDSQTVVAEDGEKGVESEKGVEREQGADSDPVTTVEPPVMPFAALPVAASLPAGAPVEAEPDHDILSAPRRQTDQIASTSVVPEPVLKAVREAVVTREAQEQAVAVPAKLAVTQALETSVADKGERPADAPQPARIAPGTRSEPVQQIKLQLSADAQPDTGAGASADRRAAPTVPVAPQPANLTAAQPVSFEAPVISADAPTIRETTVPAQPAQPQAVRPQDLTALVDRLVEARENARSGNASLTVMHSDFGQVSMRFAHDNGNLTVSLANNDPGFTRAVNAAVAPDGSMNADTQPQGDRRDGGQNATHRTTAGEPGSTGERGGNARGERNDRGPAANPSHREAAEARQGQRGIFA